MKIAELFVALGFKVEGKDKLDDTDLSLQKTTLKAGALAVAVNGLNYAFLRMVDSARQAAVEFKNFSQITGLSTDELKRWQAAAAINDVSAEEVAKTIKSVQQATANIALGRGNIAPFQMLGVAPNQDTFRAIDQMAQSLRALRPEIAAVIAADAGIGENMFQWMMRADFDVRTLEQRYILAQKEQARLISLNRTWQEFLFTIKSVRDRFASNFAPVLEVIARALRMLTDQLARFVDWLGRGSTAAKIVRGILIALIALMAILGVTIAGVASALALATAAMTAFNVAAFPLVATLTLIAAVVALIVGGLVTLALMMDDLATAAQGGKSFFEWSDWLVSTVQHVQKLTESIDKLLDKSKALKQAVTGAQWLFNPGTMAVDFAMRAARGASTVTQQNTVNVHVDGAAEPKETAKAVADTVATEISEAGYQMPVPNF